jgi:hypothetical protein
MIDGVKVTGCAGLIIKPIKPFVRLTATTCCNFSFDYDRVSAYRATD